MSEIDIERIIDVLNLVILNFADYCDETGEPLEVQDDAMVKAMALHDELHERIPRPPQKTQEVESLGDWRTGDIVQTGPNSLRYKVEWAKGEDVLISEIGRPYEINLTKWDMIIPARTKEQRLRDELGDTVRKAYLEGASDHIGGLAAIVDTLIAEGWTKEPKP